MKPFIQIVVISLLSVACGDVEDDSTATRTLPKGTASLHVEIVGIRSAEGEVNCSLWDTADGFPGESPLRGGGVEKAANGASVWCVYEALPAGRYALSAYHDENGNGTIDMSAYRTKNRGGRADPRRVPVESESGWAQSGASDVGQQLFTWRFPALGQTHARLRTGEPRSSGRFEGLRE